MANGDGNQNPNPQAGAGANEIETLKQQVQQLTATIEDLKKDNSTKDSTITDLANSRATLEQRLNELEGIKHDATRNVGAQGKGRISEDDRLRIQRILNNAGQDPEGAGDQLLEMMKNSQDEAIKTAVSQALSTVTKYNELNAYIEKVKSENPELKPFEALITSRASTLMQNGKPLTEALDSAVKEAKESLKAHTDKIKSELGAPPLPEGAGAEGNRQPTGGQPPAPPAQEPTGEQHLQNRKDTLQKKIL